LNVEARVSGRDLRQLPRLGAIETVNLKFVWDSDRESGHHVQASPMQSATRWSGKYYHFRVSDFKSPNPNVRSWLHG
jgi:hypothetical protein